jgi:hypothetical protein
MPIAKSLFVVRPFGTRNGIDFNRIHAELIKPACDQLGIRGGTTELIARAGNIREDMFQLLVSADLVIADISVHNANVFYELGIRHGLRDKRTVLLRCKGDDVPFDLRTDRYLEYDAANPGASVVALVTTLQQTFADETVDSPVFKLLPALPSTQPRLLLVVPTDFRDELQGAESAKRLGDIGLLAEEAQLFPWAWEALRDAGQAQFRLGAYGSARATWEAVRTYDPNDDEANGRLATILQKLAIASPDPVKKLDLLGQSDIAVERVLKDPELPNLKRAELLSLRASNAKTRWIDEWQSLSGTDKREGAVRSGWLDRAFADYDAGFAAEQNHYYSGINALALLTVRTALARALPDAWASSIEGDPAEALRQLEEKRSRLATAVDVSLESAKRREEFQRKPDPWLEPSRADFLCLTSPKPGPVGARYTRVLAGQSPFTIASIRRQLELYRDLGVVPENATAALQAIDRLQTPAQPAVATATDRGAPARVLLFTGHRIDAPGRAVPRFPARAEPLARQMIEAVVDRERALAGTGRVIGLAGGASGGDIIFLELCAEKGIETELFLAGPRDAFVAASVQDAGHEWVERFNRVYESRPFRQLGNSLELPRWSRTLDGYSVWQRNNLWLLNHALVHGAERVTLIALWNGEAGDGPGGTADMVERAKGRGAKVVLLDAKPLTSP